MYTLTYLAMELSVLSQKYELKSFLKVQMMMSGPLRTNLK